MTKQIPDDRVALYWSLAAYERLHLVMLLGVDYAAGGATEIPPNFAYKRRCFFGKPSTLCGQSDLTMRPELRPDLLRFV